MEQRLRRLVQSWWRPFAAAGIAGTVWVNGVVIPLANMESADGLSLAALIGAVAAAFAVRTVEKRLAGRIDPQSPDGD